MHYFKFNIGDYHKKAGRLTMLEHGAYTLLLHACYDREFFPTKDEAIDWCWARTPDEVAAVEFVLGKFFRLEDGRYVQDRIQEEIDYFHGKSEKNKHIALQREAKRRTERARNVLNFGEKQHEAPPNQEPKNQEPLTSEPKEKTKGGASLACPADVEQSVWDDFLKIRKANRAPLTDTALAGIKREAQKAGVSLQSALELCCERGWRGFKADWVNGSIRDRLAQRTSAMNTIGVDDSVPEGFGDGTV